MRILPDSPTSVDAQASLERPFHRPALRSETYIPVALPSVLNRRDMILMFVGALFLFTNAVSGASGDVVSLLYLIIGAIIFFIPCVLVVLQLGTLLPHEGSLYNWTYHALGPFWSFLVGLLYWLTGILAIITAASAFVTTLQGLNNAWLPAPWQQGLVMLAVIGLGALLYLQRLRTTQNILNIAIIYILLVVALSTIAILVWFLQGHHSQTTFTHLPDWNINPSNFFFFGIITLNFIGASGPLNMAGEFQGARDDQDKQRSIIRSHLTWGALIAFACYFLVTLSALVIRGATAMGAAAVLPFEGFTAIYITMGTIVGNIAVVGFLLYCVIATTFYGMASSRLLLVGAIDQRLPAWFGKLTAARIPRNAILFQTVSAWVIVLIAYIGAPALLQLGGSATNTQTIFYTVISASVTLVWTLATAFFFINAWALYRRNPRLFTEKRALPLPLLWISSVIGFIACILTIIGILAYSWIPTLIDNGPWLYTIAGAVAAVLVITTIMSIFATSEASWQTLQQGEA